jgi:hypothetical protein
VSDSLQSISAPHGLSHPIVRGRSPFLGILMMALTGVMVAWLVLTPSGKRARKQIEKGEPYHMARNVVGVAAGKVGEVASSKPVRDLRHYVTQDGGGVHIPFLTTKKRRRRFLVFG